MPKRKRLKLTPKEEAMSTAYLALFGGFLLAYLIAEAALAARPHPVHWVVALTGALVIAGSAYGITLWRLRRRL